MKYGILTVSPFKNKREKFINIGDMIQEYAIYQCYMEMGVKEEEIVVIDFQQIKTYHGEYVLLPICLNIQTDYELIPFPEHIIPCFIGLSLFAQNGLDVNVQHYLKRYEPIGCRDEFTLNLLRRYSIDAYLAGCVTATLDRRAIQQGQKKLFLVDVAEELIRNIPDYVFKDRKVEIFSHILVGEKLADHQYRWEKVNDILNKYKNEAALVITSRLHSLSPCMAMGIPVIGLFSNISPRMAWIDKLITLYTVDDMDNINWSGEVIDYDDMKVKMKQVIIDKITCTYDKYHQSMRISEFFEERNRSKYGSYYYKMIKKLPQEGNNLSYIIWGAGQIALEIVRVMNEQCNNSEFVGIIDTYSAGKKFLGKEIESPDVIHDKYKDVFCIVATHSGRRFVAEFLRSIGKDDYISFATVNG